MGKKNLAAIDLGTNSCRLRITDNKGNLLYMTSENTKLGEGMQRNGAFTEDAIKRGVDCFVAYSEVMKSYGVEHYRAIATAACRTAVNGAEFVSLVKEKSGINIDVIGAREEAILNLRGASINVPKSAKYILVYDLGGGSTEITLARNDAELTVLHTVSIPWGARNATEKFALTEYEAEKADCLRAEIAGYVNEFCRISQFDKYRDDCCCVATSSTPLRLLTLLEGDDIVYDKYKADGKSAATKDIDTLIDRIYTMKVADMAKNNSIGINRAPIFTAACVIFRTIYQGLEIKELTASLKGALDAIIQDLEQKWQN